jgi:hypothetical protein
MDKKKMYRLNAADMAVAVLVIALSIAPLFSFNKKPAAGALVNIYEDGRMVKQAELSIDAVYKVKNVEIQVEAKKVRILRSDCPHQICVHTGWISSPAQTIVCVPNKVLVEIKNNSGVQGLDAVSY